MTVDTGLGIIVADVVTGDSSLVLPHEMPAEEAFAHPRCLQILGWSPDDREVF